VAHKGQNAAVEKNDTEKLFLDSRTMDSCYHYVSVCSAAAVVAAK
jgi:hypothetical protein